MGIIVKARWLRLSAFHPLSLPGLHLVVHDELDLVAVVGQDLLGEGVVKLFAKGARVVQPPGSCILSLSLSQRARSFWDGIHSFYFITENENIKNNATAKRGRHRQAGFYASHAHEKTKWCEDMRRDVSE